MKRSYDASTMSSRWSADGGAADGGGGGEWFADAPKQWLMNAFQNHGQPMPKLMAVRGGYGWSCRVEIGMLRQQVTGSGHTQDDAKKAAALEGCRVLQGAGMLQRQVSNKNRGGATRKKKKKGGANAEANAQRQLSTVAYDAPPFVLPFKRPVFNGAQPGGGPVLSHTRHVSFCADLALMRKCHPLQPRRSSHSTMARSRCSTSRPPAAPRSTAPAPASGRCAP